MDDSSDFFSEEYESYVKDLHQTVTETKVKLSEREIQLLSGISTQHTTEGELKSKVSSIFGKLINQSKIASEMKTLDGNQYVEQDSDEGFRTINLNILNEAQSICVAEKTAVNSISHSRENSISKLGSILDSYSTKDKKVRAQERLSRMFMQVKENETQDL